MKKIKEMIFKDPTLPVFRDKLLDSDLYLLLFNDLINQSLITRITPKSQMSECMVCVLLGRRKQNSSNNDVKNMITMLLFVCTTLANPSS